jgi:phosphonate metabolism-associated iron-containing alcohol dehydrogenase
MMADNEIWESSYPSQIVFGPGSVSEIPRLVSWRSILVVTTSGAIQRGSLETLRAGLGDRIRTTYDEVSPEPKLDGLETAGRALSQEAYDGIIAIGGGSAIDTAKTFAYLLRGQVTRLGDHLRAGAPLPDVDAYPVLAVPTTAGTGAEVTPFATIWDATAQKKYSLALEAIRPTIAVLDPNLSVSAPRDVTLTAGLDALCQGIEALWSRGGNTISSALASAAVLIAIDALPLVVEDRENIDLRSRMLEASLLAGLAISKTKTTLSHSISYPLTLRFGIPHGLACAFSIAQVLRFNAGESEDMDNIFQRLGYQNAEELVATLIRILEQTGAMSRLAALLPPKGELVAIAPEAISPGRADNNPRNASVDDVAVILTDAWDQAMRSKGSSSGIRMVR